MNYNLSMLRGRSLPEQNRQCVLVLKLRNEIVTPCSNIEDDPGADLSL
jgi:hypothetical protein